MLFCVTSELYFKEFYFIMPIQIQIPIPIPIPMPMPHNQEQVKKYSSLIWEQNALKPTSFKMKQNDCNHSHPLPITLHLFGKRTRAHCFVCHHYYRLHFIFLSRDVSGSIHGKLSSCKYSKKWRLKRLNVLIFND